MGVFCTRDRILWTQVNPPASIPLPGADVWVWRLVVGGRFTFKWDSMGRARRLLKAEPLLNYFWDCIMHDPERSRGRRRGGEVRASEAGRKRWGHEIFPASSSSTFTASHTSILAPRCWHTFASFIHFSLPLSHLETELHSKGTKVCFKVILLDTTKSFYRSCFIEREVQVNKPVKGDKPLSPWLSWFTTVCSQPKMYGRSKNIIIIIILSISGCKMG